MKRVYAGLTFCGVGQTRAAYTPERGHFYLVLKASL